MPYSPASYSDFDSIFFKLKNLMILFGRYVIENH